MVGTAAIREDKAATVEMAGTAVVEDTVAQEETVATVVQVEAMAAMVAIPNNGSNCMFTQK